MSPLIRASSSYTFSYFVSVPSMLWVRVSYTFLSDSLATDFPDSGLGFTVFFVFFLSYFLLCRTHQRKWRALSPIWRSYGVKLDLIYNNVGRILHQVSYNLCYAKVVGSNSHFPQVLLSGLWIELMGSNPYSPQVFFLSCHYTINTRFENLFPFIFLTQSY